MEPSVKLQREFGPRQPRRPKQCRQAPPEGRKEEAWRGDRSLALWNLQCALKTAAHKMSGWRRLCRVPKDRQATFRDMPMLSPFFARLLDMATLPTRKSFCSAGDCAG